MYSKDDGDGDTYSMIPPAEDVVSSYSVDVTKDNGKTAGSIGLMKFGDGTAVLKKFFVYEPYRGAPCHLGRQLYGTLLDYARTHGVKQLILDTPKNTDRAHKFYERAGFTKIERADVPVVYDFPYEDSDFFRLEI